MKRGKLSLGLLALMCAVGAAGVSGAPPPANVATTATFDDAFGTVRSDGGDYQEGTDCIRSWFNSSGSYYLRTASNTLCDYPLPPDAVQRAVVLDFSNPPVAGQPATCSLGDGHGNTLDLCGPNTVPDVRLFAGSLFKSGSVETPVYLAFDLYPNFANDTAFNLQFVDAAPIIQLENGARRIDIIGVAELSVRQAGRGGKSRLVPVARYSNMSLSLTVTPTP